MTPRPASLRRTNRLLQALLTATALTAAGQAAAQVTPVAGGPAVIASPGAPVINIVAPDASGLSHNRYADFNVGSAGVVLNNQSGAGSVQTQLATIIGANPNLANGSASKILNEVTSTNRSVVNGFIEVAGQKADVFIANPNGITCGGCGFINTGAATLTTGTPVFTNGVFQGFNVAKGDILIQGTGVNASAADYLALVARSIKVDGQLNAPVLDLVAGRNSWDANLRTATALASDGSTAPQYAIDSTVLGGMYAGRIRLIATEVGVGVRALGDAAATAGDFSIDAAGKVALSSKVSAANLSIASKATGADAVSLTNAALSSTGALTVAGGATGGVTLAGGVLSAGGGLTLSGATLNDTATTTSLTDNNKRAGAASTTLTFTGASQIGALAYASGGAIAGSFGSLAALPDGATIGSNGALSLTSTAGDLAIGAGALKSVGALSLTASGGLSTGSTANIVSTTGAVAFQGATIANAGAVSADAGALNLRAGTSISNAGTLNGFTGLTVGDLAAGGAESFTNTAYVVTEGGATIKASAFNTSGELVVTGDANLAVDTLANAGKLTLGATAGHTATVNARTFTEAAAGVLQSYGTLNVVLANGGSFDNAGKVLGATGLGIGSTGSDAFTLANRAGAVLQATTGLTFSGHGAVDTQLGSVLGATVSGVVDSLNNAGVFQSTGAMTLAIAKALTNSGTLTASVAATPADSSLTFGSLSNASSGLIQSAANLALNGRTTLANAGKILVIGDVRVRETDGTGASTLAISNTSGALLQSGGELNIQSFSSAPLNFASNAGQLIASRFAVELPTFSNTGLIQGDGGSFGAGVAKGAVSNSGTITLSTTSGSAGMVLTGGAISNTGTLQAVGSAQIMAGTSFANASTGLVNVNGDLKIVGDGNAISYALNNAGVINVPGALTVGSDVGPYFPALWQTTLTGVARITAGSAAVFSGLSLSGTSSINTVDDLRVVEGGSILLSDVGTRLIAGTSGAGSLTLAAGYSGGQASAQHIDVSGLVYAPTAVSLSAYGINIASSGGVLSGGALTVGGPLSQTTIGGQTFNGPLAHLDLVNNGQLYSAGLFKATVNTFTNASAVDVDGSANITASERFTNVNHFAVAKDLTISTPVFENKASNPVYYDNAPSNFIAATLNKSDSSQGRNGGELDRTSDSFKEVSGLFAAIDHYTASTPNDSPSYGDSDTGRNADTYPHLVHNLNGYTFQVNAHFAGSTPTTFGALSAGSTLTVKDFNSGQNIGGTISASTINLQGAGGGATFTDQVLYTGLLNITATWTDYVNPTALYIGYTKTITSTVSGAVNGGQIRANTLNASGFGLAVNGPPSALNPSAPNAPTGTSATSGSITAVQTAAQQQAAQNTALAGTTTFGGVTVTLPSSPNGLFVVSQDPASKYLVVTNPVITTTPVVTPPVVPPVTADPVVTTTPVVTTPVVVVAPPTTPVTSPTTPVTTPTTPVVTPVITDPVVTTPPVSSDYLATQLGLDADKLQQRLGDAAYEQYLIQQQLLAQAGSNRIYLSDTYAQQTKALYDQAATEASSQKLKWGVALTPSQQANLKSDIVWMVSTVVQGHTVLAPVVYLAASTKSVFDTGTAVIAANDANLKLTSLVNAGGAISGIKTLVVNAAGDITNTSGLIRGGDVTLTSTGGSIINQTAVSTIALTDSTQTNIGATATIQATNLKVNAAKDVKTIGGTITVANNVDLKAGRDIVFDSIQDQSLQVVYNDGQHDKTTTSSTTNVKSNLTVGGALKATAGQDITFAATNAKVGGDAKLAAGRDVSIVSRTDTRSRETEDTTHGALGTSTTTTTHTDTFATDAKSTFQVGGNANFSGRDVSVKASDVAIGGKAKVNASRAFTVAAGQDTYTTADHTTTSGLGVSGALYGNVDDKITTKDSYNVASNFKVGGALTGSANTVTIQGSNAAIGGASTLDTKHLNILNGQDTHIRDETKSTTVFLGGSGSGSADGQASGGLDREASGQSAQASMGGQVAGQINGNGGLTLTGNTTTITHDDSTKSVASNFTTGGKLTVKNADTMTIQGSTVSSGGAADLDVKHTDILAGRNEENHSTRTVSVGVGYQVDSSNQIEAHAVLSGSATGSAGGDSTARGVASSGAGGFSVNGNGGAAQAGLDVGVSGSSNNNIDLVQAKTFQSSSHDVTHTASTLNIGGKLTVTGDSLHVTGSDITTGGAADLKVKTQVFDAAKDEHATAFTSSKSGLGAFADIGGQAVIGAGGGASSADGGGSVSANAGASGEAGVGYQIHTDVVGGSTSSTVSRNSTLTTGGNLNRTGDTITDVGTTINVGGLFRQDAKTYQALASEDTQTATSGSASLRVRGGLYADAGASASAQAEGSASPGVNTERTSTAGKVVPGDGSASGSTSVGASAGLAGSLDASGEGAHTTSAQQNAVHITVGGKTTLTSSGQTTLHGAQIASGGKVTINADSLDYTATKNTTTSYDTAHSINNSGKLGLDAANEVALNATQSYAGSENHSTSTTFGQGQLLSGGGLAINTKKDANLQGTQIASVGAADLNIGGKLNYTATHDTAENFSGEQKLGGTLSYGGRNGTAAAVEAGASLTHDKSDTANVGGISAGGRLSITTGGDANFEGTSLAAGKGKGSSVFAGGKANFEAATSMQSHEMAGVEIGGGYSQANRPKTTASTAAAPAGAITTTTAAASGATTPPSSNPPSRPPPAVPGSAAAASTTSSSPPSRPPPAIPGAATTTTAAAPAAVTPAAPNQGLREKLNSQLQAQTTDFKANLPGQAAANAPAPPAAQMGVSLGLEAEQSMSSTQQAAKITSGAGFTIRSGDGHDIDLKGTTIDAKGKVKLDSGGAVNFSATKDTSESVQAGLNLHVGKGDQAELGQNVGKLTRSTNSEADNTSSSGTMVTAPTAPVTPTTPAAEKPAMAANAGLDLGSGYSSQETAGSVRGSQVEITARDNANFTGTQITSTKGGTKIAAGKDVTFTTADGLSLDGGLSVSGGTSGGRGTANGGVQVDHADGSIASAGPTTIDAGGKASFTSTTIDSKGPAAINAVGGIDTSTTVSGGGELGLTRAGVNVEVNKTDLGGATQTTGADAKAAIAKEAAAAPPPPIKTPTMQVQAAPPGAKAVLTLPNGQPAPSWVKYDAATGKVTGTPPADFKGQLNLVVTSAGAKSQITLGR